MNPTRYPTKAVDSEARTLEGHCEAWEEDPAYPEQVKVRLHLPGLDLEASADDYFTALVAIRTKLDTHGIRLTNYGSSLDVYPSPMSRSMGSGEKAYRLRMGEPAKTADLVSIFETGPDIVPSSVPDQERFYREWVASLRK